MFENSGWTSYPNAICMKFISTLDIAEESVLRTKTCVVGANEAVDLVQKKTSGVTLQYLAIECQNNQEGYNICKTVIDELCSKNIVPCMGELNYNGNILEFNQ